MFVRFIVTGLILILSGCNADTQENAACFVCSDQAPYARICDTQLGRLEIDGDVYSCNLYFGHTHKCESADRCCQQKGMVSNDHFQCVLPQGELMD